MHFHTILSLIFMNRCSHPSVRHVFCILNSICYSRKQILYFKGDELNSKLLNVEFCMSQTMKSVSCSARVMKTTLHAIYCRVPCTIPDECTQMAEQSGTDRSGPSLSWQTSNIRLNNFAIRAQQTRQGLEN